MENYSINYSDESLFDLQSIFEYISIELKATEVATAKLKHIRDEIRTLSTFPKRNKAVEWEPWAKTEMRQMSVDNFIVFYIVNEDLNIVQIVRIFYGKRDIPKLV